MTDTAVATVTLEIRGLHASVEGKEILKGIDLVVRQGETHALMGPNGSGKSTLANVLMGRPGYKVTAGEVLFKGENILALRPDQRAQRGLLLITHYQRILNYVTPDFVHVMIGGRIVKSGGQELAHELEEKGYEGIRQELGIEQENGEKEA